MDELPARLRAAVRRSDQGPPAHRTDQVTTDDFTIDLPAKKAVRNVQQMPLGRGEPHFTAILVTNPGRLVTQKHLLQEVWGVFGSTWPNCGANWSGTPRTPAISSQSPGWATASSSDPRPVDAPAGMRQQRVSVGRIAVSVASPGLGGRCGPA